MYPGRNCNMSSPLTHLSLHMQLERTSVHHKTSPTGGVRAFGYPDPNYFVNCNEELDALNVPSAIALDDDGKEKGGKGSS